MEIIEDCFFFQNRANQEIYGCSYEPRGCSPKTGVIIVPPVGQERLRCLRESVTLARFLAQRGFPVFRFDYRGEGESSGAFEGSDVQSRLDDISEAIREFKERNGVKKICLFGVRIGALFSLIISKELSSIGLVFCEPIFDNKKYVNDLIRSHIIIVKQYFPKMNINTDDVKKKLDKGESISLYGFHAKKAFLKQLGDIDVDEYFGKFIGKAAIISFSPKDNGNEIPRKLEKFYLEMNSRGECGYSQVRTSFSWMTKKLWTDSIPGLAEKVAAAIEGWNEGV